MCKRFICSLFCLLLTCLLAAGCNLETIVSDDVSLTAASSEISTAPSFPTTETDDGESTILTSSSESAIATEASTSSSTLAPTVAPKATAKPTVKPTPRPTSTPSPTSPYYLYAEMGSFTLVVYAKDSAGNYSDVVRTIRMAIGRGTMTRAGTYTLSSKLRWKTFSSSVYAQYASQYKNGLYIHSPCYTAQDNTRMITSSYDEIGTKATSGCLRIPTADACWIYSNCPSGTVLQIVSGSPRGFTAPFLIPIRVSGHDPTDPDPNINPAPTTATTTVETTPTTIETIPAETTTEAATEAAATTAESTTTAATTETAATTVESTTIEVTTA